MGDTPKRIQRKRTKGWKMPEGAVYVGRPTKWGNPYRRGGEVTKYGNVRPAYSTAEAVEAFRNWVAACNHLSTIDVPRIKAELRGKDLACWCPIGQACHADVLLEIANAGDTAQIEKKLLSELLDALSIESGVAAHRGFGERAAYLWRLVVEADRQTLKRLGAGESWREYPAGDTKLGYPGG